MVGQDAVRPARSYQGTSGARPPTNSLEPEPARPDEIEAKPVEAPGVDSHVAEEHHEIQPGDVAVPESRS